MSPARRTEQFQNDWSDGQVRDVAPTLISPRGAERIVNALLDEDGNPYRRGGTEYDTTNGLGSGGLIWNWEGYLKPGARSLAANSADFGVKDGEGAFVNLGGAGLSVPKQSAVLEELLYIGGGTLYGGSRKSSVYSTKTVTVTKGSKTVTGSETSFTANVDAGMLFHIGSERVYIVASVDSNTQITLRDAYEGESGSGKSYTLNPVWTVGGSDPYEVWDYVTVCANRLVGISGRKLIYSEVNNPHKYESSILETANEHTIQLGEGVGLATVGQTVLVFTTGGIVTLDGLALDITDLNGNAQHRLQTLSNELVCAGAAGIASYGQTLVVPAGDGVYLVDGVSQPVRISKPVSRQYRQRISDGYRIGGAAVDRSHYFLPIITGAGVVKEVHVCRLDRPSRDRQQTIYPWSQLAGDGGKVTSYAVRRSTGAQEPTLIGCQSSSPSRLLDCSGYFEPANANAADADGSVHTWEVITRAFPTGQETLNAVRAVETRYELVDADEEPRLQLSYNDGSNRSTGTLWGLFKWGKAKWGGSSGSWTPIGELGPSDGRKPKKLRINKKLRHVRIRIRSTGPTPFLALRSLQLNIRPTEATRL